jgi:UDP-N-acetylmuramoyl-tripeptide--D-alanyl-D-alanine ligase
MLQDTEYRLDNYFSWYHRTRNFNTVMKRRTLTLTRKVKLLRLTLWTMWGLVLVVSAVLEITGLMEQSFVPALIGLIILILLPFIQAYAITIPLLFGQQFIQKPKEQAMIAEAKKILADHKAVKIAIVGSYGKTTVKEMLSAVLSESKKVAATPGNMNTLIGVSRFAKKLDGDEDVLVIEYGEEAPGDVTKLAELSSPTMAVMTGINEAHLVSFKTIENTIGTIFEISDYLGKKPVYKNGENTYIMECVPKDALLYSRDGVHGWKVTGAKTSLESGTEFTAKKGSKTVKAKTKLIGLHSVGPTVAVIAIADELALSVKQIEAGLHKVEPFEHRMQPRQLHGAWIIDDTYNGNSDGVAAGLALLREAQAVRKVYVTPGLVEQGSKTQQVHEKIGEQIAVSADVAVLMKNSVTDFIITGLHRKKFKGDLMIIDEPLDFYTNLDQFIAKGDIVLMQNDWTDNYR